MKTIIITAVTLVILLSSCEKCMKCEYTDRDDVVYTEDLCGSKDETEALYQAYKDSSIAHRSTFSCIEDF